MSSFQKIFRSKKNEIWGELSREIGAEFYPDSFFKPGKIVINQTPWQITLDTYTVKTGRYSYATYTRIRAPYVNPSGFRFNIYQKQFYHWLGKLFGRKYIELGDIMFDEKFVVKSSSEKLIKHLLQNREIRHLIQKQPYIHLQVIDDEGIFCQKFPKEVDELYFQTGGVIKDKQRLKELFDLFILVLNELCRLGAAIEKDPCINL